ncbi:MAG: hypothetical protein LBQ57_09960 [Spirochaetales bacterium]|jgi:hypothetical protein|nr:hypothetical protein [Spirochaetales bacterium]
MRLTTREKKAVAQAVCTRCRQAGKKQKTVILDEFVRTTGYNRKYAVRVLNRYAKAAVLILGGKALRLKAAKARRPANRTAKPVYGPEVLRCLRLPGM